MSESKSFLVTVMKWRLSGQGYKHLTRFLKSILFKPAASTMQKINPQSLSLKVRLYTFISCYLKKIIKIGFLELEKKLFNDFALFS